MIHRPLKLRRFTLLPALCALVWLTCLPGGAKAQEKLVDQVRKSIDKGVQFLRDQEQGRRRRPR